MNEETSEKHLAPSHTVIWVTLIIAVITFIIAFLLAIWIWSINNKLNNQGVRLNIQNGAASGVSETMNTGKYNLYIANKTGITVIISANSDNKTGRQIYIKNNTPGNCQINTNNLTSYDGGNIGNSKIILPGITAQFVFTNTNRLLRLS